jgi:nitrate reductase gamma subunit
MNYDAQANTIFYTLSLITTAIFVLGLIGMIHKWRLGKARLIGEQVSSKIWIISFLKAIFLESQILEYGLLSWTAHMMIFWGFFCLLLLTSIHFVIQWFIPSSSALFQSFQSGIGNVLLAVWGDFWGLVFLAGILIAILRRYVGRPETVNTIADDSVAIWLLFLVSITGFMCEAVRLAVQPESHDAQFSFAVSWLVPVLRNFALNETHLTLFFWIHVIFSFSFLIYIPFSKFRHIFASPLDYAYVTGSSRYSKKDWIKRR